MSYKTIDFHVRGVAPLLMHNGQIANPVNKFAKAMKAITSQVCINVLATAPAVIAQEGHWRVVARDGPKHRLPYHEAATISRPQQHGPPQRRATEGHVWHDPARCVPTEHRLETTSGRYR